RIDALGPRQLLDERRRPFELAVGAVHGIADAVAVGVQHQLLAVDVDHDVLGHRVVIVGVVRRLLEVPLDLAGVGVERQRRIRVEVVAGAEGVVPIRARIADAPVDRVAAWLVGAGDPGRAAAGDFRVVVALPGLDAGLALAGDGVGAPDLLLGVEVGCRDPAADAVFGAGDAGDRHVLDDQRRAGDDFALVGVGDLALPLDLPSVPVGG